MLIDNNWLNKCDWFCLYFAVYLELRNDWKWLLLLIYISKCLENESKTEIR